MQASPYKARQSNPLKSFHHVSAGKQNHWENRGVPIRRCEWKPVAFDYIEKLGKLISGLAVETVEQVA
jgi:hypothetical protein